MNTQKELITIGIVTSILLALTVSLTGCSGATGWQFNIGVTPVTAIDHHETLVAKTK